MVLGIVVSFLSSLVCFWGFYPYPCFCSENTFCDCVIIWSLSSEITCRHFNIMFQLSSGWKQKRCQQTCAIYSHALLRIHIINWRPKVGEDCSSTLPPHHYLIHWEETTMLDHGRGQELWWRRPCTSRWHPQRSASTEMEDWKSLVAGLLWYGGREGEAILTDLWPPMTCILSSAWLWNSNVYSHFFHFRPDDDWTFGWNIGKLFPELKLVTGNFFNYAETNEEPLKVYLCDFFILNFRL